MGNPNKYKKGFRKTYDKEYVCSDGEVFTSTGFVDEVHRRYPKTHAAKQQSTKDTRAKRNSKNLPDSWDGTRVSRTNTSWKDITKRVNQFKAVQDDQWLVGRSRKGANVRLVEYLLMVLSPRHFTVQELCCILYLVELSLVRSAREICESPRLTNYKFVLTKQGPWCEDVANDLLYVMSNPNPVIACAWDDVLNEDILDRCVYQGQFKKRYGLLGKNKKRALDDVVQALVDLLDVTEVTYLEYHSVLKSICDQTSGCKGLIESKGYGKIIKLK